MRIARQTRSRTWIEYSPAEVGELGLRLRGGCQQVWHNMYDAALRALMARGVALDRAVRFILRGSERRSLRLAVWLQRRAR